MTDMPRKAQAAAASGSLSAVLDDQELTGSRTISSAVLLRIALLAGLFVALNYRQLRWITGGWLEMNWSYCFLIPLFSLYLLYVRRRDIAAATIKPALTGLVIMVFSIVAEFALMSLRPPGWQFLMNQFVVIMLFGLVLHQGGWQLMRVVWLPVLYLSLAVPWSEGMYNSLAYPMQELAAKMTVPLLRPLGVDIMLRGVNMQFLSQTNQECKLTVAEACSGMRLMVAFVAIAVAIAYLDNKPIWQRVVLVAAGIPIAIISNILRVGITSYMFYIDRQDLGTGFMHSFTGLVMLVPAFAMMFALSFLLRWLFVSDDEDEDDRPASTAEEGA